jgi:hypothetical protein
VVHPSRPEFKSCQDRISVISPEWASSIKICYQGLVLVVSFFILRRLIASLRWAWPRMLGKFTRITIQLEKSDQCSLKKKRSASMQSKQARACNSIFKYEFFLQNLHYFQIPTSSKNLNNFQQEHFLKI